MEIIITATGDKVHAYEAFKLFLDMAELERWEGAVTLDAGHGVTVTEMFGPMRAARAADREGVASAGVA